MRCRRCTKFKTALEETDGEFQFTKDFLMELWWEHQDTNDNVDCYNEYMKYSGEEK